MAAAFDQNAFIGDSESRVSHRKVDKKWERMKRADDAEKEKFKALVYGVYNDIITTFSRHNKKVVDEQAPVINRDEIDRMLDILTIKNPPYLTQKNPAALILSYVCVVGKKINMEKLKYLHKKVGMHLQLYDPKNEKGPTDTPIRLLDMLRYARFWIQIVKI